MAVRGERRLVERIVAGDAEAVEEFIFRYQPFIYAILLRSLNLPPEDAEDIFQQFLFHLCKDRFRRFRQWKGRTKLSSYLAKIVRNLAHDYRRQRRPADQRLPDIAVDDPGIANIELAEIVRFGLERLSAKDHELIYRRFILDQKPSEIADALHMTRNNVGVALSRAKHRLKKILSSL